MVVFLHTQHSQSFSKNRRTAVAKGKATIYDATSPVCKVRVVKEVVVGLCAEALCSQHAVPQVHPAVATIIRLLWTLTRPLLGNPPCLVQFVQKRVVLHAPSAARSMHACRAQDDAAERMAHGMAWAPSGAYHAHNRHASRGACSAPAR